MTARLSNKDARKLGLVPKRHKYRAVKTVVDGLTFASKKEARRYGELKALQAAGKISGLGLHPGWSLNVNGVNVGMYFADFVYMENGKKVVEDVKGFRTPVYKLKKKLMEAFYGIEIIET